MNSIKSRYILGLMRINHWGLTSQQVAELVSGCLDLGVDTIDVADIYCDYQSESIFGAALRFDPSLKTKVRLISECGIALVKPSRPAHRVKHYNTTCDHIISSVENSLACLGVERLSMLLIHRPDPLMNADEIANAFDKLKRSGKVEEFGVSNFLTHQFELLQSRVDEPLKANQFRISLLHPDSLFDGTLDQCQKLRVSPQAWSPLGGGELARPN